MTTRPVLIDANPVTRASGEEGMRDTLKMMQDYMLKKGLIMPDMNDQQLQEFLHKESNSTDQGTENETNSAQVMKSKVTNKRMPAQQPIGKDNLSSSASETTIYRRAVRQINPNLEAQIEDLLNRSRTEIAVDDLRKVSYSSDENMDTSDEGVEITDNNVINSFTGNPQGATSAAVQIEEPRPGPSHEPMTVNKKDRNKMSEEQAQQLIKEAELSKAQMFEVTGKINVSLIDEDYQMIDAHIEDSLRRKILNFEYIDFSKLVIKNQSIRDDDQPRLEIINKNGMSFLSPVSDRETVNIGNYGKWEQAFRVYSNVITSAYPQKSPELLQYNHTIHTASQSYIWDNVCAYDREF